MKRTTRQFVRGIGSVLQVFPPRTPSRVGEGLDFQRSDAQVLRDDMQRVAIDFRTAYDRVILSTHRNGQPQQEQE